MSAACLQLHRLLSTTSLCLSCPHTPTIMRDGTDAKCANIFKPRELGAVYGRREGIIGHWNISLDDYCQIQGVIR